MITSFNKHGYTHMFSLYNHYYLWRYSIQQSALKSYYYVSLEQLSKHSVAKLDCVATSKEQALQLINFHLAYLLESFRTTYDDAKLSGVPCICCRSIFENDNDFKYSEEEIDYICEECYTAKQEGLIKEESTQETQYTPMHYVHCVL